MRQPPGAPAASSSWPMIVGGLGLVGFFLAFVVVLEVIHSTNTRELLQLVGQTIVLVASAVMAWNKVSQLKHDTASVKEDTAALRNGEMEEKITSAVIAAIRRETPAAVEDVLVEHDVITVRKHPRSPQA